MIYITMFHSSNVRIYPATHSCAAWRRSVTGGI